MGSSLVSVVMKLGLRTGPDVGPVDSITLFVVLLCACILIGHLLEKNRWMNESITALFIVSSSVYCLIYRSRVEFVDRL